MRAEKIGASVAALPQVSTICNQALILRFAQDDRKPADAFSELTACKKTGRYDGLQIMAVCVGTSRGARCPI